MERLEIAQQKRLAIWTASDTEFTQNQEKIRREAEIIAAISHVLKQDEMEDAGDEAYEAYCDALKNAAIDLIESVKTENAAAARASVGEMTKACAQCHEDYRG
jgi:cytochrome c556